MTTAARQRYRAARVVTELSAPAVLNTVVPLVIGAHAGSVCWGFVVSLCSGLIPIAYILAGVRTSKLSDHHVTDRAQRPAVLAFILASLVVGLGVEIGLSAPRDVIALTGAMLATLVVIAAITVGLHWKVSVHTAVAAGSVIMLAIALSGSWLLLLLVVPVVMWSRVELDDHSRAQVVVGAVVGAVVAGVIFTLVR